MNNIRALRLNKGIQAKELALEIGVTSATVSDWEHGRKKPSGERLAKLAEYFDVDEAVLLGRKPISDAQNTDALSDSEAETIIQHILDRLQEMPTSPQIKLVSGIMGKMSSAQQNQVVAVVRAMFANHPEILDESEDEK